MIENGSSREQEQLRRYLLRQADAETATVIEQRLMTDPQYFAGLGRVEEALIDEYVCSDMSSLERRQFELHFAKSPERCEAVEVARALREYAISQQKVKAQPAVPSGRRWIWMLQALAAGLLLVAVTSTLLLYRQTSQLKQQIQRMEAARAAAEEQTKSLRTQSEKLTSAEHREARPSDSERQEGTALALVLSPGLSRSPGKSARLIVPPDARSVRLELEVAEQGYTRYRAELQTIEGTVVSKWTALQNEGRSGDRRVVVTLPVSLITRSDYLFVLQGENDAGEVERAGSYYFKVTRK